VNNYDEVMSQISQTYLELFFYKFLESEKFTVDCFRFKFNGRYNRAN